MMNSTEANVIEEAYDAVLVISDTHIGLPEKEIFGEDFQTFVRFLASSQILNVQGDTAFTADMPKAIVLLGDYLDFWDGKLSGFADFALRFSKTLTERFDVYYVRGNHDYLVPTFAPQAQGKRKFEICEFKVLEIAGRPCFFIHGHQFDSAFGSVNLNIESIINPYHSLLENFASKFTSGHGKLTLDAIAILAVGMGVISWLGLIAPQTSIVAMLILGLLIPVTFVTIWRTFQKTAFKAFTSIFGDLLNRLRGAARGDTIQYLTKRSKPIDTWFKNNRAGSKEAKKSEFVCFGHTHIPEGPIAGTDGELAAIRFLNPGSWMRPPSELKQELAKIAKFLTRLYDKFDQYLVIAYFLASGLATLLLGFLPISLAVGWLVLILLEVLVALGKTSYRSLSGVNVRSLAFIGNDSSGARKEVLLYWDPDRKTLICK